MIALLMVAAVSSPFADNCNNRNLQRQFVVRRQNVIVQAVPQIFYFVGGNLRAEAGYGRQQQQDAYESDYAAFQEFRRWKRGQSGRDESGDGDGDSDGYDDEPEGEQSRPRTRRPPSILRQLCYECHRGDSPKGDFYIGDSMNPGDVLRSIREIAAGRMPPHRVLSREVKNRLLAELLAQTPVVQPHEPEPTPAEPEPELEVTPIPTIETEVSP